MILTTLVVSVMRAAGTVLWLAVAVLLSNTLVVEELALSLQSISTLSTLGFFTWALLGFAARVFDFRGSVLHPSIIEDHCCLAQNGQGCVRKRIGALKK